MYAKTNSESKVKSEWHANLNETFQLMWISWKWFSVELQESPTPVSAMVSDLGWEPLQTRRLHGRLNMFFSINRAEAWSNSLRTPECHPVPRHQPAARGHSQLFQRLQPSVDAYKYAFFPRTFRAWNALPVELVEAESLEAFKLHCAVTPVTSPHHVYILHDLFFFCTCSCSSSFMHYFRIVRSAIAVRCDYTYVGYVWRDILATY